MFIKRNRDSFSFNNYKHHKLQQRQRNRKTKVPCKLLHLLLFLRFSKHKTLRDTAVLFFPYFLVSTSLSWAPLSLWQEAAIGQELSCFCKSTCFCHNLIWQCQFDQKKIFCNLYCATPLSWCQSLKRTRCSIFFHNVAIYCWGLRQSCLILGLLCQSHTLLNWTFFLCSLQEYWRHEATAEGPVEGGSPIMFVSRIYGRAGEGVKDCITIIFMTYLQDLLVFKKL